jgi:hypothetical protein
LVVHPRDHDLVIGTHGRALLVIDDVRPLRALAADPTLVASRLHTFEPPPAVQHEQTEPLGYRSTGDAMFFGENRPYGALISFWAGGEEVAAQDGENEQDDDSVVIDVLDAEGSVLRTLRADVRPGINRVVWDLETTGFREPGEENPESAGPEVIPGEYRVRVRLSSVESTTTVRVELDPRSTLTLEDRRAQFEEARRLGARLEEGADAVDRLRELRETLELVRGRVSGADSASIIAAADSLERGVDALDERFTGPRGRQGIVDRDDAALSRLDDAASQVSRGFGAPTPNHRLRARHAEAAFDAALAELDAFFAGEVAGFAERVRAAGITLLPDVRTGQR